MMTEKEIQAVQLSPTARDFYQIWNELIETASKLSDRWDPNSTNETDPGIILLKVLTAIADKLNYTIDKNILEAFMPSATQEESMRKLCEMLGYNMKYYRSATTTVQISYTGEESLPSDAILPIPQFTSITNIDNNINYVTLEPISITAEMPTMTVLAIEGMNVAAETENEGNKITLVQLDNNNRFHLPETQIAENGIFVTSGLTGGQPDFANEQYLWKKVDNLNTQPLGKRCYKFGFNSKLGIPYLQFPDDVGALIDDGIYINYIRTSGIKGNISARSLSSMSLPDASSISGLPETLQPYYNASNFTVTNITAATDGNNLESLDDAYAGYKKTIGTFDTLVTCRDYMNKIYQMTIDANSTIPLVSNVLVTDIRDDINKAVELCSFNEYGICYKNMPRVVNGNALIDHFDLILYPFTVYNNLHTAADYLNSFKYSDKNKLDILAKLEDNKTLSHDIRSPEGTDIACVKIYHKLQADIVTTRKVNPAEEKAVLAAIKMALFRDFNMRKLDFSERIDREAIEKCIKNALVSNADIGIKYVSLYEPALEVAFCCVDGSEFYMGDTDWDGFYNQTVLNNVLAGRIPLFNYDTDFTPSFDEADTGNTSGIITNITKLEGTYEPAIPNDSSGITPLGTEVIRFRAPSLRTDATYGPYTNYRLKLSGDKYIKANTEYFLDNGEYLLINYTSVSTDGSDTETIKNEKFVNAIIKPNFDMYDSDEYSKTHTSTKKNYNFPGEGQVNLFTLGTNEQVETRSEVQVTLNGFPQYVYWIRNDDEEKADANDQVTFEWNTDGQYELKDGEYFFYTDKNKMDLGWFSKGTLLTKGANTPILTKRMSNESFTAEDILVNGLNSSINWVTVNLSQTDGSIIAKEYRYINLTAGDKLESIEFAETVSANKLTSQWLPVTAATYSFSGQPSQTLPELRLPNALWEVQSTLEFDLGPNNPQELYQFDKITVTSGSTTTISGDASAVKCIKSNYLCQTSVNPINITKYTVGSDTDINFKIKQFIKETPYINGQALPLNNFGKVWTNFDLTSTVTLQAYIPAVNQFGLLMIYYMDENAGTDYTSGNAYITTTNSVVPKIYNNGGTWWSGYTESNKYYLKSGINIIELNKSTAITINPDHHGGSSAGKSTLILGNMDLITVTNSDGGLNPRLNPAGSTPVSMAGLLAAITLVDPDHQFYYNNYIDNSLMIDLNLLETDQTSANYETLASPKAWYDANNINNKFVISELDAAYLNTGIKIASSSKL